MDILDLKVGSEDRTLTVIDIKTRSTKNKHDELTEKVIFRCKDEAGPEFEIDSAFIMLAGKEEYVARDFWLYTDPDGQIRGSSTLGQLLKAYGRKSLREFIGKKVIVMADDRNFLLIKVNTIDPIQMIPKTKN